MIYPQFPPRAIRNLTFVTVIADRNQDRGALGARSVEHLFYVIVRRAQSFLRNLWDCPLQNLSKTGSRYGIKQLKIEAASA